MDKNAYLAEIKRREQISKKEKNKIYFLLSLSLFIALISLMPIYGSLIPVEKNLYASVFLVNDVG